MKQKGFKAKSRFETRLGEELVALGVDFTYESTAYRYNLKPYNASCHSCGSKEVYEDRQYTPDFFLPNGIIVEAKGKFTAAMRTKMLAVIKTNPELDLRMVFMRDNWLTSAKKKRYSDWCTYHGIKSAVGSIPEEWINEKR